MNFDEAISAHQKWKTRLRVQLAGSSAEVLRPEDVAKDDRCDLGRWIHGEGKAKFSGRPEFLDMVSSHADFHQVAAQVLRLAQGGKKTEAEKLLDGDFFTRSAKVVTAISRCKGICKG